MKAQDVIGPDGVAIRREPVVGDLQWDGERWRRWSGRRWARAAYSLHPDRLLDASPLTGWPRADSGDARRALDLAVEHQVTGNGATIVHDGPSGVLLGYRRPVAHVLHAVLTVLTAGLWIVGWLLSALAHREDRVRLEVDPWGHVWARPGKAVSW